MVDDDRGDDEMDERSPQEEPQAEAAQEGPEPEAQEPEAEAAAEEAGHEAAEGEAWEEPPPAPADLNVFDMLRAAIGLFAQEAWIAMGVQARPGATEVVADLRCASVAIDTTQMLIDKLGDEASGDERREFDHIMTDLRINFVRRQAKM